MGMSRNVTNKTLFQSAEAKNVEYEFKKKKKKKRCCYVFIFTNIIYEYSEW